MSNSSLINIFPSQKHFINSGEALKTKLKNKNGAKLIKLLLSNDKSFSFDTSIYDILNLGNFR